MADRIIRRGERSQGHAHRADLIAFAHPYFGNPDLVERFAHGWPLNPPPARKLWYSSGAEGYPDFPCHPEA